jgi:hypothetical protein
MPVLPILKKENAGCGEVGSNKKDEKIVGALVDLPTKQRWQDDAVTEAGDREEF